MGEDKYLQKGNLEHERGAITCMYGAKEKLFRLKTWLRAASAPKKTLLTIRTRILIFKHGSVTA
tara:strand:- start:52 stop:243 length:192 start_codon:yes stop_codon:yes gene_type:complete